MDNDKETEKPSRHFLKRLYDELKESGELSLDSFQAAVRKARASAGGTAKAAKAKTESAESLTDLIDKVQSALYNQFRNEWTGISSFSYAKEVFSNYVIACSNIDGKDYKIPYSIINDEVQFGEPEEVETIYVPVGTDIIGMHEVADLCADGRSVRLFMEQSFADVPEWINYLPKPGVYESPKYGTIVITKERNQNFINNFKNKVYQESLPIDAEHDLPSSGAVAWIVDMRLNEDESVDAKPEWNERGKKLIEDDRFKYFSPAWFSVWTDPAEPDKKITDVAIGGALTTRPFFKEKALRPLVANERGLSLLDSDLKNLNSESVVILNFTALSPVENSKEKPMPDDKPKTGADTVDPQQFAEVQTQLTEAQTKLAATESELANTKTALTAAEEKANKADERITSLEKEARAKRFSETSKDWVGDRSAHVDMLEFLFSSDEKGEEGERYKKYVEQQNAAAEQVKSAGIFSEVGSSAPAEGSAMAKINAMVKQCREGDPKLTEEQAFNKVWEEHPDLRQQYREEERRAIN